MEQIDKQSDLPFMREVDAGAWGDDDGMSAELRGRQHSIRFQATVAVYACSVALQRAASPLQT